MKSLKQILLISLILIAITFVQFINPQTAYAACSGVVYVAPSGSGAGGCSWAAAFPNLQNAIALAVSGDQIWVAAGTYYPDQGVGQVNNDRASTFNLKNGVSIYGGFAGTETLLSQRNVAANLTILSGNIDQVAGNVNNAYHVVTGDALTSSAVLDGFTVTDGNANGGDNYGGGIYLTDSSPTLSNLIFSANEGGNGGGLAGFASSSPTLTDVTFSNNIVSIHGGGIYLQDTSNPTLLRVTFSGNSSYGYGGGIAVFLSSPILTDVTFNNNQTTGPFNPGGGMYTSDSTPVLNRVTFSNNRALDAGGGGMYNFASNVLMTNVTFANNTAYRRGGAMANETASPVLNNVTFSGNTATLQASGGMANFTDSDPVIRNSIMWGDTPQEVVNSDATSVPQFIDSIVQGGCPTGSTCTNVLSATAPFTIPATLANNGGFTQTIAITSTSSARDAGNNATCAAIDQTSFPRALTLADPCDMGAYEFEGVGTVAGNASATYGSTSVSLFATVTPNPGGGTIQFYINGNPVGSPASINAGTGVATLNYNPSAMTVGAHTIRADFSGFGGFPAGSSNPTNNGTLTINPATLTVTANNKSHAYGTANPALDATITGFVNGETLATSDVTGAPTCSTTATPASPVSGSPYAITCITGTLASTNYTFNFVAGNLTVTPATLTVTANNKSRVYGAANPAFDAAITGFVNGETLVTSDVTGTPTCSTTATPTSPVSGSPYTITCVVGTLASTNYSFNFVAGNLTITPATLTVTANNISKNYGDTVTFVGTEFTTSGLVGTDTITSVTLASAGAVSTATVAGSPYAIVPSAAVGTGLGNYTITYINGTLTVNPIALTITANNLSKNYGVTLTFAGTEFTTSGLVGSDTVTSVTLTSAGAASTATVAGSPYAIVPSAAVGTGLGNYTIAYTNGLLTINPIALTITANNISKNYGATVTFAGTEFTTTGLVGTDTVTSVTLTSAGAVSTATVAGSPYPIVPSAAVGTGVGNYTITYTNGLLTVNPIALTITADNLSKSYGTTVTFAGTEFTTAGLVGSDTVISVTLTSAGAASAATVAGSPYPIVPSAATGTGLGNYTITYTNGSLTVNPIALTITANNLSKNYGTTVTFAGTEFTTSGLVGSDTVTSVTLISAGAAATATVAGSPYAIVPSAAVGTGLGNYTITYTNGLLTVNPIALTITANNISKNYGDTVTFAGTEFTTSGLVGTDAVTSVTLTSAGAASTATVAGSPYAIVPSAAVGTGLGNYTITYTNGLLTVNPITLTITANNTSKNYGATVTFAGTEFTTVGLIGSDTVTSVTLTSAGAASTATVAGSPYAIVPSVAVGTGLGNYAITYTNGTLTVNPIALTITANNINKNYGDTVTFAGTEFTTSGLIGSDTVTSVTLTSAGAVSTATVAGSPYTIVPSAAVGSGLGNYTITYTNGVLTVNGVIVVPSITANDKTYDGTNAATFTCSLSGVVSGDVVNCTGTATFADKNVGNNKTVTATGLTLSGANSANYTISTTTTTDTANITVLAITVTAVTDTKVYDGTTSSTGVPTTSIALATGDSATWTQTFNTKHVGTNKTLTPAGTINDGNGGGNYAVTFVNNTTGVITTRAITVTAVTDTKPFDGTTSSAGVPTITVGSLGTGDTATWTQTFDTPLVGTGKTLTPAGSVNDSNSGNNYAVTFNSVNTGSITGVPIGVSINQASSQLDPTNASPINFTVVFIASVSNFATGDVTLSGTAVGGGTTATVTGSGTTYNVAVSGMVGNGTVIASIPAAVASDGAGNINNASTSTDNTVTYDGTAPSVTIEQAVAQVDPTNASPINFTVTFSEAVSNFATGDVNFAGSTVGGALVGTVTGGGTTYNVAVTGMTGTGTVVASIAAGAASDAAGNGNTASSSVDNTVTFDGTGPTVTIEQAVGQADPTSGSPITFTVTFSEAVSNFATGDVNFTGSTVGGALVGTVTGGGTTYSVAVTGMTGNGTVIASIPAGAATDTLGNNSAASTSVDHTVTFDGTGPTVTINQAGAQIDPTGASPINFTVTFSELVSNFATGDVDLTGSTAPGVLVGTVTGSGTTYNVAVTGMTGSGTVIAAINAGVASDALGNGNVASTSTDNTVTYDTSLPSVTIDQAGTQADPTNATPINFTVTFSEVVFNFATGDVSFTGSTALGTLVGTVTSTGLTTYNVAVTGMTGNGTIVATIAAGVATDSSGNGNSASTSTDNTVTYDTTRPIVTVGAPVPTTTITGPADFAVTVTGATTINLTAADVTLNTTGTAAVTTVTITNGNTANPTVTLSGISGNGTIIITIAAGIASDGSGNTSLAASSATPLLVDNAGPIVLFNSNTVPGDNATVTGGPMQLKVAFNENVKNDGSAGAANNTANYLLVASGPNLTLDTVSCLLGVQTDDVQYTVNTANYTNSGGKFIATLAINGGTPLPVGTYHLFVCGTTSIEDLTNNELNNGAADTVIDFTVVQATAVVPKTGFPMNSVTNLPIQPEGLAYASTDMWMEIPGLNVKMPIVGVSKTSAGWDVTWLDKNAGWLDGTTYPTWSGNSVITAHVWDALNQPGPFARLKELKYGDQVKIHAFGQVYTYEIRETTAISPANATAMLKHQDKSWLTLVTCEGFQELTKEYSTRRMVRAVLVSVTAEK